MIQSILIQCILANHLSPYVKFAQQFIIYAQFKHLPLMSFRIMSYNNFRRQPLRSFNCHIISKQFNQLAHPDTYTHTPVSMGLQQNGGRACVHRMAPPVIHAGV